MSNTTSIRLQTFKKNLICVDCGITGLHFWVECSPGHFDYHLNLYEINKVGDEILMTKDHIIPKSKNGKETLDNMQTMCTHCNYKKGSIIR
jgi:5-methylcytosine-specific restriction endonuclease McrA